MATFPASGWKKIHKILATHKNGVLPQFDKILIGQPVNYSRGSFLRFALGAHDVRRFHADGFDKRNDINLINAVEKIVSELVR